MYMEAISNHVASALLMFMQVVKRYMSVCIELNRHRPLPNTGSIGGEQKNH